MPLSIGDLKRRFAFDDTVIFPSVKADDFLQFGLRAVPASYTAVKEAFGNSRLASDESRFWIAAAQDPNPNFSIAELKEMLKERLSGFFKRRNEHWRPVAERNSSVSNYPPLLPDKVLPLFCNSEYDYWLCWNLERSTREGEPEVIFFDLGLQKLFGKFPDLTAVYEALSEGQLVERLPKDSAGKIPLTGFEPW